jgi:UDP-2-acetamido-2,6-beta-L-arabino-hexul-4-ose reductase
MRVLVTGAKGFVGKNLCAALKNIKDGKDRTRPSLKIEEVFEYDIDTNPVLLDEYCQKADFVFNLAGVNRPKEQSEFMEGNFGFASTLLDTLKKYGNRCPVMLSSSQQASLTGRFGNSEYGRSKKAGEDLFLKYQEETGAKVLIYRFPNLFGKWCRPNYNSAVATFCNNIANDLPIQVNDPTVELELLYIDDLVQEMFDALEGKEHRCEFDGLEVVPAPPADDADRVDREDNLRDQNESAKSACTKYRYCYCPVTHKVTLGRIVELLHEFAEQPKTLLIPEIPINSFEKKLYSTYLSYLPKEKVAFPLKMNVDNRGSFTELVHTLNCGQVSINISKPGITKGQHWHNTKWEFFIVVSGHGLIQMRAISPLPTSPSRGGDMPWRTADPSLYEQLKEHADRMRKKPTEAEAALWEMLRGKNLDAKFRRQYVIGDYIADFVCLKKQLVIEVDGEYHNSPEQQVMDRWRTNFLQSKGFSVLRFTNNEVLAAPEETMTIIRNALKYLPLEGGSEGGCWFVSGDNIQCVHMLPGYTHNIINLSETENLVTVMYCNELFDPNRPDTFFEPV